MEQFPRIPPGGHCRCGETLWYIRVPAPGKYSYFVCRDTGADNAIGRRRTVSAASEVVLPSRKGPCDTFAVSYDISTVIGVRNICTLYVRLDKSATVAGGLSVNLTTAEVYHSKDGDISETMVPLKKLEQADIAKIAGPSIYIGVPATWMPDSEYLVVRAHTDNLATAADYQFQVRHAGPYWLKMSLAAALAFHKPSDSNVVLAPSPVLFSAVAWGYEGTVLTYIFPRSVGIIVTPTISSTVVGDILPSLVPGVAFTFLNHNLLIGVARNFSEERTRVVIGWNAIVSGNPKQSRSPPDNRTWRVPARGTAR